MDGVTATLNLLLAGVGGESPATEHAGCGDQVSTPDHAGPASARPRRRHRRGRLCTDTTLTGVRSKLIVQIQIQMEPALATLSDWLCILSPHHDCGHTEAAPDPEITRVQEEVCSAEKRC